MRSFYDLVFVTLPPSLVKIASKYKSELRCFRVNKKLIT